MPTKLSNPTKKIPSRQIKAIIIISTILILAVAAFFVSNKLSTTAGVAPTGPGSTPFAKEKEDNKAKRAKETNAQKEKKIQKAEEAEEVKKQNLKKLCNSAGLEPNQFGGCGTHDDQVRAKEAEAAAAAKKAGITPTPTRTSMPEGVDIPTPTKSSEPKGVGTPTPPPSSVTSTPKITPTAAPIATPQITRTPTPTPPSAATPKTEPAVAKQDLHICSDFYACFGKDRVCYDGIGSRCREK